MPSLRLGFLTITFAIVSLALIKVILEPKTVSKAREYQPYTFPQSVPLSQWKLNKTESLSARKKDDKEFFGGKRYQYKRDRLQVDINMYYLVNTTGNVNDFLKNHYFDNTSGKSPGSGLVVRQQPNIGFYNVFLYDKKIQIVSCINPRGGATANISQFFLNRRRYDYSSNSEGWQKWVSWFLGQEELQDRRCMWSHLSMPVGNLPPQKAFMEIEKVWFSWYDWWQNNFPKA